MLSILLAGILGVDTSPHSQVRLFALSGSGSEREIAVVIDVDPGWHTYWQNPGESGQPIQVDFRTPGWKASSARWSAPELISSESGTTFGYSKRAVLTYQLKASTANPSPTIAADVRWLICESACLPARERVTVDLRKTVGRSVLASVKWPAAAPFPAKASATKDGFEIQLPMPPTQSAYFFPADEGVIDASAKQALQGTTLPLMRSPYARGVPGRLRGVLQLGDSYYDLNLPISEPNQGVLP